MKAVVMAVRPGEVVILDKDGCFRIVKDEGYAVGQILEVEPFTAFERHHTHTGNRKKVSYKYSRRVRVWSAAAAAMFMVICGGGAAAVLLPVSDVTVEASSSVIYHLNLFDRVVSVEGTNDENPINVGPEVKGQPLEKAIELTLDKMAERGEIAETEPTINVTIESGFHIGEKLEDNVSHAVDSWNSSHADKEESKVMISWEPRRNSQAPGASGESEPLETEYPPLQPENPGLQRTTDQHSQNPIIESEPQAENSGIHSDAGSNDPYAPYPSASQPDAPGEPDIRAPEGLDGMAEKSDSNGAAERSGLQENFIPESDKMLTEQKDGIGNAPGMVDRRSPDFPENEMNPAEQDSFSEAPRNDFVENRNRG